MKHSGNTPLHLASVAVARAMMITETLEKDMSCVLQLLEQGAEVDGVNKAGMTPLQEALQHGQQGAGGSAAQVRSRHQ